MATTRKPYLTKAVRLAEQFRQRIRSGSWAEGSYLPAELALAKEFAVARVTIRRCLGLLEQERIVRRVPHRGLLVGAPTAAAPPPRRRHGGSQRRTIAVLAPTEPSASAERIIAGIAAFAGEQGAALQLISTVADVNHPLALLGDVESLGVDGVIVLPYPGEDHRAEIEGLHRRRFPIVCVERRLEDMAVPSVEVDNRSGMYRAVCHLLERYHRPVHYLGLRSRHKTDTDRFEGYRRAMIDAGYGPLVEGHVILHDWDTSDPRYWHAEDPWRQGHEVAQRLFAGGERHFSIACQKDDVAWGCCRAAAEAGLQVGHAVHVTGFDDLPIAARLDPPLTTVRQPLYEKGWQAAWLLQRLFAGQQVGPLQIRLPTELVLRGSA